LKDATGGANYEENGVTRWSAADVDASQKRPDLSLGRTKTSPVG